MVKFRGIDISIVSQLDAGTLSEFATTNPSGIGTHAICYIPVHPGSQIWFEYSIDGPHPPQAAYLFKLFINEQHITSWDCTDKHGYHGKTAYLLAHASVGVDDWQLQRSGFRFTNHEEENNRRTRVSNDCIEIRIHRIEHRQRIKPPYNVPRPNIVQEDAGKLRLIEGGVPDPWLPRRRYKYQLVDPVDEPYATFRFYYRDYEWLEKHGFLKNLTSTGNSFATSSIIWHDPDSSPVRRQLSRNDSAGTVEAQSPDSVPSTGHDEIRTRHDDIFTTVKPRSTSVVQGLPRSTKNDVYCPPSDSEESLSTMTCDSIEDLPSQVPRSPQYSNLRSSLRGGHQNIGSHLESPTKSPSSRKQLRKTLTIDLKAAQADGEEVKRRPMSPFTNGGMLRRFLGPAAQPALADVRCPDPPHLDRSVQPKLYVSKIDVASKLQHPRTGKSLMNFLGRHTVSGVDQA